MRTANFTLQEVAHRPLPAHLIPNGVAAMQHMQAVRDAARDKFGKVIPLRITSGYRELAYNRSIGSSDGSYHIWRVGTGNEQGRLLFAVDFMPVGINLVEFWKWYQDTTGGERYCHRRHNFIHTAPNAMDKKPWIQ